MPSNHHTYGLFLSVMNSLLFISIILLWILLIDSKIYVQQSSGSGGKAPTVLVMITDNKVLLLVVVYFLILIVKSVTLFIWISNFPWICNKNWGNLSPTPVYYIRQTKLKYYKNGHFELFSGCIADRDVII